MDLGAIWWRLHRRIRRALICTWRRDRYIQLRADRQLASAIMKKAEGMAAGGVRRGLAWTISSSYDSIYHAQATIYAMQRLRWKGWDI
jgi:hypothetical protein